MSDIESQQTIQKKITTPISASIVLFTVIIHSIASLSIKILNPLENATQLQNIQYVAEYTAGVSTVMTFLIICVACYFSKLRMYDWIKLYQLIKKWCFDSTFYYCVIYSVCDVISYLLFSFLLLLINSTTVSAIKNLSIIMTFFMIMKSDNDNNISKRKMIKIMICYGFIIVGTFLLALQQKWTNNNVGIAFVIPTVTGIRDYMRWRIKNNTNDVLSLQINVIFNVFFLIISFVALFVVEIAMNLDNTSLPYKSSQIYKAILSTLMSGVIYTVSTTINQWSIQTNDASVLIVETLKCSGLMWIALIDYIRFDSQFTNMMIYSITFVIAGNLLMILPIAKLCQLKKSNKQIIAFSEACPCNSHP